MKFSTLLRPLLPALCWCVAAHAGAQSAPVTTITLERDCNGCPTGTRLELHRDGRAVLTTTGKERLGTSDGRAAGTLRVQDFDRLARYVVSQGFFELDDLYDDAQHRDGGWATIGLQRGTQNKQVFKRDGTGPSALTNIEQAIEAAKVQIIFSAERR